MTEHSKGHIFTEKRGELMTDLKKEMTPEEFFRETFSEEFLQEAEVEYTLTQIESLKEEVDELKKALNLACREVENRTGDCPYGVADWEMPNGCENCSSVSQWECWRDYYLELGKTKK